MKRLWPCLILLLAACAHLPAIQPMDAGQRPLLERDCQSHFPQGRWQLVHTIAARLQGGRPATFTGVVVLSTRNASIHCVLMTLEGMVLFEAADDGRSTTVQRAFGPFDNRHFTQGVMADIRHLFFKPDGDLIAAGTTADGERVCRYRNADATVVDLTEPAGGGWRLDQYDPQGRVLRRVTADAADARGISARMAIDAGSGRRGYHLALSLVDAVQLP